MLLIALPNGTGNGRLRQRAIMRLFRHPELPLAGFCAARNVVGDIVGDLD